MAVTVGGIAAAAVVKLHTKVAAIAVPVKDFAPVVTVIVTRVLRGRAPAGVNRTVLVAAVKVTAPAMGVVPGPVTAKLAAIMVVGSIGLLKVAVIAVVPTGTPITPHPGLVDTTVGGTGSAIVLNVHPEMPTELTPRTLFAAVLMFTVYVVLNARLLAGVKVAIPLA
jgi:hypothetical protein